MREYLTRDQLARASTKHIETSQNARFHATCTHLLPHTRFYRELFQEHNVDPAKLTSPQEWKNAGLPLIKKATYLKRPRDFIVTPDIEHAFKNHLSYLFAQHASGSALKLLLSGHKQATIKDYYTPKMLIFSGGTESGNPAPMLLTTKQKMDTLMNILRIAGSLIVDKTEKTVGMNLFPYAPHLGWHAVHHALDINCDLNLCTAAGGAIPTEKLVSMAETFKPNVICGMNDYLRNRFLPLAIKRGIKLPRRALFINGAQKMLEAERQQIIDLASKLGVQEALVLDMYAASELKEAILPECSPGSGFHHIAPLSTIIKTVSATHTTRETIDEWDFTESGYAVSWNIDGGGSLLAGYLIGDTYERVINNPCPHCKLNVQRIYNVNRIREAEAQLHLTGIVEEKVKGSRINLVALRERALSVPEVREAQIVLAPARDRIEVRYVSSKPAVALKKLHAQFSTSEVKIKLVNTTLEKLHGDKLKYEPIKLPQK